MQETIKREWVKIFDFENMNCAMPDMTGNLEEMTNFMQMGGTDAGNALKMHCRAQVELYRQRYKVSIISFKNTLIKKKEDMFLWAVI